MSTNITDVDEFTDPITVPEDGDDRDALSVHTPFQGLSNRTRNLLTRITDLPGTDGDWTGNINFAGNLTFQNELLLTAPQTRVCHVAMGSGQGTPGLFAYDVVLGVWRSLDASGLFGQLRFPLPLPRNCTIERVRVAFKNDGDDPADLSMTFVRDQAVHTPPYGLTRNVIGSDTESVAAGAAGLLDLIGLSSFSDPTTGNHQVNVSATAADMLIYWAAVTYSTGYVSHW